MGSSSNILKAFTTRPLQTAIDDPSTIINPGEAGLANPLAIAVELQGEEKEKRKTRASQAEAAAASAAAALRKEEGKRAAAEQSVRAQQQKARRRTTFAGQDIRENLFRRTLEGGPQRRSILGG